MSKKIIIINLVVLILVLALFAGGTGYFSYRQAAARYHSYRVIFDMEDAAKDDRGPGTYKYPTDSIFDPKSGHFDLLRFTVSTEANQYFFDLKIGKVTNPWGAAEGFSHQIAEIYIANGSENGRIETFKEGARVQFSPQYPWTSMIKVVSFKKSAVYAATDDDNSEGRSEGVMAALQPDKETIRVTVPRQYIDGDPYQWRYYVIIGSQDGSGPDNFRPVLAKVSQWNFSGGTNTRFHPNVIDVLAPASGPDSQEKMLGSFNVAKGRYALLQPVGPTENQPDTWEQFLVYMEQLFTKYEIKL